MGINTEYIVKLLQLKGVGRSKVFKIESMLRELPIQNDQILFDFLKENRVALKIPTLTDDEVYHSFNKGVEIINESKKLGIKITSFFDSDYPEKLKQIPNPPIIINTLGNFFALCNMPAIAVIGTREPSSYGLAIGERIGYKVGESKINLISGLAKGCDTAAHIGCLKSRGITTAVLAHGLDSIYPKENYHLAQQIVSSGGCLLSEYFIGMRPLKNFFVERDRIQAALAQATIVVETDIKGGTMHAVRSTIENKSILAAFSHPIDRVNEKSRGNEKLINEGVAIPIADLDDMTNLINTVKPKSLDIEGKVSKKPLDAIQLPAFDLESITINEDYLPTKKRKKSKRKKKANSENEKATQKKLYE